MDSERPNFTGGRLKAQVPKLGHTYSVELWARNQLSNQARPVTGYLFSRGIEGAEGAPGDSLGIGGTFAGSGRLLVYNGNQRGQFLVGTTLISPKGWSHVVMVRRRSIARRLRRMASIRTDLC